MSFGYPIRKQVKQQIFRYALVIKLIRYNSQI